ncbi:DUF1993 family protein [Paraburkholderia sp. C35]|uniref:DUF1993 family protein n=1 Tax=Paraburkholderia sp. C35 TaxID=2126993 RepID=UPI000D686DDE|nr:DUF1993 family protein [Paraburkholderia sp. C35]
MWLTNFVTPTLKQTLEMLGGLLDRARRQMPERADALMSGRLTADMFPLASQLRLVAFHAQESIFKIRGESSPEWLDALSIEAHDAVESPGTMEDAQTRIDEALWFLEDNVHQVAGNARSKISLQIPEAGVIDLSGEQYFRDFVLPQFYFHSVTAYAILLTQGVNIGKLDFIPQIFAYVR